VTDSDALSACMSVAALKTVIFKTKKAELAKAHNIARYTIGDFIVLSTVTGKPTKLDLDVSAASARFDDRQTVASGLSGG
jgi:hypothetical protein